MTTFEFISILAGLGTCFATIYLAFFAYIQVKLSKTQNKQKATVELLIANNSNSYYRERRKLYLDMRRDEVVFASLAKMIKKSGEHERKSLIVMDVLNAIEFICVGIREGIFDEDVYKRMSKGSVMNDWETLHPFIFEIRKVYNNDKLFCEFEWLIQKWKNENSNNKKKVNFIKKCLKYLTK